MSCRTSADLLAPQRRQRLVGVARRRRRGCRGSRTGRCSALATAGWSSTTSDFHRSIVEAESARSSRRSDRPALSLGRRRPSRLIFSHSVVGRMPEAAPPRAAGGPPRPSAPLDQAALEVGHHRLVVLVQVHRLHRSGSPIRRSSWRWRARSATRAAPGPAPPAGPAPTAAARPPATHGQRELGARRRRTRAPVERVGQAHPEHDADGGHHPVLEPGSSARCRACARRARAGCRSGACAPRPRTTSPPRCRGEVTSTSSTIDPAS